MPLAIFDLDGTLIKADSASLWSQFMVESGIVETADFLQQEEALMQLYAAGELDMTDYMSFSLAPLKGKSEAQISAMVPGFIEHWIRPCIYPQAFSLLDTLKVRGYRLLVISATAEFLVRPIAQALGISEVLAIDLEFDSDGCHTGRTSGILTFREGKVLRLQQWLQQHQLSLQDARFYSDSINDLPLLESIDYPVATNPDPQLRKIAAERGWQQLDWQL